MARETGAIRRNIEQTRAEIDTHLTELSGQVRGELDVQRRARQNLPQVLAGMAIAGLFAGFLVGRGGRPREERLLHREERKLAAERARLASERKRWQKERGRAQKEVGLAELTTEKYSDIP